MFINFRYFGSKTSSIRFDSSLVTEIYIRMETNGFVKTILLVSRQFSRLFMIFKILFLYNFTGNNVTPLLNLIQI